MSNVQLSQQHVRILPSPLTKCATNAQPKRDNNNNNNKNNNNSKNISDVDSCLLSALSIPRDRVLCVKCEKECIRLLKGDIRGSCVVNTSNSYQRLIVHRVADYYGLEHVSVDAQSQKGVCLTKTAEVGMPSVLLTELPVAVVETSNADRSSPPTSSHTASDTETPTPTFKIMRRRQRSKVVDDEKNCSVGAETTNSSQVKGESDGTPATELELQKREEEYEAARALIFGEALDGDSGVAVAAAVASVAVGDDTPNDDDDDSLPELAYKSRQKEMNLLKTMTLLKNLNPDLSESVEAEDERHNSRLAEEWAEQHLYDRYYVNPKSQRYAAGAADWTEQSSNGAPIDMHGHGAMWNGFNVMPSPNATNPMHASAYHLPHHAPQQQPWSSAYAPSPKKPFELNTSAQAFVPRSYGQQVQYTEQQWQRLPSHTHGQQNQQHFQYHPQQQQYHQQQLQQQQQQYQQPQQQQQQHLW